ncbi:MAG: hypothetical protein ABI035_06860, partial [Gemmatimonadaceae bacterium]
MFDKSGFMVPFTRHREPFGSLCINMVQPSQKQERPDRKAIWPFYRKVARLLADLRYVLGRGAFLTLHDLELDA